MEQKDISRFVPMHQSYYAAALSEIKAGRKRTHWMWYIFPQLAGIVSNPSWTNIEFSISGLDEARAFLSDSFLGANLIEISTALLQLETCDPKEVFPYPDDLKLRSSMTLFSLVADGQTVFDDVLKKYFGGRPDYRTLSRLGLTGRN